MNQGLITVLTVLLCLLIFLECFNRIKAYTTSLYHILSSWFADRTVTEESVEELVEEDYLTGRYDVYAYRERMKKLQDEDGLYDIPDIPEPTDFTGVEIAEER